MDKEPKRLLVAELHDEVARLLGDPASVWVRAAGDVLAPPGRERDEDEDVDPLQEDGLDREEVAGEHTSCSRSLSLAVTGHKAGRLVSPVCARATKPRKVGERFRKRRAATIAPDDERRSDGI
jgi:hypothetical protein